MSTPRSVLAALTVLTVLGGAVVASCGRHSGKNDVSLLGTRRSILRPLAWLQDGRIAFARADLIGGGDVWTSACDSTGLFLLDSMGKTSSWASDSLVCRVLHSSTVAAVSLSPDRGELIYSDDFDDGNVHKLNVSSRVDTRLTSRCAAHNSAPSWSPDGRRIAFSASCAGSDVSATLSLMSADGRDLSPVPAPGYREREDEPSWSPNGQRIVLSKGTAPWRNSLVTVDLSTGRRRILSGGAAPAWSPTGDWIAFCRWDSSRTPTPSMWLVRPDGRGERRLFGVEHPPTVKSVAGFWISGVVLWSNDGRRLAFGAGGVLWTIAVDGSQLRPFVGSQ